MISLEDCVALSGMTEEQVLAIAEHEHLPEIAATALAQYLSNRAHGMEKIRDMIVDDIRQAQQRQDKAHILTLLHVLHHFLKSHPEVCLSIRGASSIRHVKPEGGGPQPECPKSKKRGDTRKACLVSRCTLRSYMFQGGVRSKFAWPFAQERFITVPTVIGGCSPSILIPVGYSSGTSPTFPQEAKSPIWRSERFLSGPAVGQRSKNSCA